MSTRAHCIDCTLHHRQAPIRATFVLCRRDVRFCVKCRHRIWCGKPANDCLGNRVTWMTGLIDTSCERRAIQIPIAMWSTLTTVKHPAVSSPEAYPTPAH